jgi:hypothetical protein
MGHNNSDRDAADAADADDIASSVDSVETLITNLSTGVRYDLFNPSNRHPKPTSIHKMQFRFMDVMVERVRMTVCIVDDGL